MLEALEWIWKHRHDPKGYLVIGVILIVFEKALRGLITDQFKRLLNLQDKADIRLYIANQKAIMENQARIMRHLGVTPCDLPQSSSNPPQTPYYGSFISSLRAATKWASQQKRRMGKMQNQINFVTLIVAVLGALKLILQAQGIDVIDDQQIDSIANGVAAIITIVGVFMSHRKQSPTLKYASKEEDVA